MPPPTVTCKICGKQVSKRSTIELQPGSKERACRVHEEALEVTRVAAKALRATQLKTDAVDGLSVIMLAAQLRVLAYTNHISNEMCYTLLEDRIPKPLREAVLKAVQECGLMTSEEAIDSMRLYLNLKENA